MAYYNDLSTVLQASDKRRCGFHRVADSDVLSQAGRLSNAPSDSRFSRRTRRRVVSDSDNSDSVIAVGDVVYACSPKLETLQGEPLTVVSVNKSLDAAVVKDKNGKCMAVRLSYLKRE